MTSPRRRGIRVMLRGLRARCPACGIGRAFDGGVRSAARCPACGWLFERCPGHWIGGNEINVIATFTTGVVAWIVAALFLGIGTPAAVVATAVTVVFGVAFYRSSRGLFYAIDYLLDPVPDAASPGGDGPRGRPRRG